MWRMVCLWRSQDGKTALHLLCENLECEAGSTEMVEMLISRGADVAAKTSVRVLQSALPG